MNRLLIAVVAGVLIGTTFAIISRGDEPAARRTPAAQATPTADPGDPRIDIGATVVRVADPNGGPPWVVRRYTTPGGVACVQLGRSVRGRFGWIRPDGAFVAVTRGRDAPHACLPDLPQRAYAYPVQRFGLADPDARPAVTVTWGFVPDTVVRVETDDGLGLVPRSGVLLDVAAGQRGAPAPTGTVVLDDGDRTRFGEPSLPPELGEMQFTPHDRHPRVAVTATDPAGGLPWVVLVARDGCISMPDRLLGSWLGQQLPPADVFVPFRPAVAHPSCFRAKAVPTRARPVALEVGRHGGLDQGGPGTIQLRRLPGRTTLTGKVHPDVESVTVITQRDRRTLVPSRNGRTILAVYDGGFTRRVRTVARFADGHTVTQSFGPG